ncbi:MAG: SoxXA-binding protein [Pseudomonadota bacterium]
MLKKQSIILFILMLLVTIGCTSNTTKTETAPTTFSDVKLHENILKVKKEVTALIAHAEILKKKAASVGGEWRDTGKFIKQAKKYQKEGQCEKAIKSAKKAISEAEMGYQQAVSQKELKMPGYFKF